MAPTVARRSRAPLPSNCASRADALAQARIYGIAAPLHGDPTPRVSDCPAGGSAGAPPNSFTVTDTRSVSSRTPNTTLPRRCVVEERSPRAIAGQRAFHAEQTSLQKQRNKLRHDAWVSEHREATFGLMTTDANSLRKMRFLFLEAVRFHNDRKSTRLLYKLNVAFSRRQDQRAEQGLERVEKEVALGTEKALLHTMLRDLASLQSTHGTDVMIDALVSIRLWEVSTSAPAPKPAA